MASCTWLPVYNMASFNEDSDSIDEEEAARLKEASLGFVLVEQEVFKESSNEQKDVKKGIYREKKICIKPSLRGEIDSTALETSTQGATPEFQKFLSTKLFTYLDQKYEVAHAKDTGAPELEICSHKTEGIKLFANSKHLCLCEDKNESTGRQQRVRKLVESSGSESEDNQKRFLEAAVSPESIFHFSATGQYMIDERDAQKTAGVKKKKRKREKKSRTQKDLDNDEASVHLGLEPFCTSEAKRMDCEHGNSSSKDSQGCMEATDETESTKRHKKKKKKKEKQGW